MVDLEPNPPDAPSAASGDLSPEQRRLLQRRDASALEVFFEAYFDRVYGYVRRLLREEHLAEDVTQDVFLQIHRSLDSYDPARELRPWVFAIATNKVRDHWRSKGHREARAAESLDGEDGPTDVPSALPGPDADLVGRELAGQVRAAIDTLPDGLRMTVLLRVFEGLSFQVIGEILDLNEATARKRYSRALEKLRDAMGAEPSGGDA